MKTTLLLKQNILRSALFVLITALSLVTNAQELQFKNSSLEPLSRPAGTNGAIYRFPSVTTDIDALVKIADRSSSLVKLVNIDVSNIGFDKAFQPQVTYNNGSVNSATSWWMEFEITFVNKNSTTPINISSFNTTALDIDGDNNRLKEWDAFYAPNSYTLESPTQLSVTNLVQLLLGILTNVGKTFEGTATDHSGIDTSATDLMTTLKYTNTSSIKLRTGATTTGSSSKTERNYSIWFKSFNYVAPVTLPVKMTSFTATLNNKKADLKWTTSSEINVSHFVIEKSTDGTNFSEAGVVFAYGNATDLTNYSFSDNLGNAQSGVFYYRIRSVDIDEKSQISETRMIKISSKTESNLQITTFPNPATNEVRITIPANWQNKKVAYQLFSANGQPVQTIERANSNQTEAINVSSLAPGLYFIKAICEGQIAQQKIIKQ